VPVELQPLRFEVLGNHRGIWLTTAEILTLCTVRVENAALEIDLDFLEEGMEVYFNNDRYELFLFDRYRDRYFLAQPGTVAA